jgi:hypothetical protein
MSPATAASTSPVHPASANGVGHIAPSPRAGWPLNPSVAYRTLNLSSLWKKPTTFPPLAYTGIPYNVLGTRAGVTA